MPLGGYGLPFFASVTALTYNKEHVKTPPQALSDLANPEIKGRVGIFNLESVGGVGNLIALAVANGGSVKNLDPGFAKLKEISPNLATATASPVEIYNLLQRGEIWLSSFWSGRVNALIDQGLPLGIVVPKEGLLGNLDFASLVKGTKSRGARSEVHRSNHVGADLAGDRARALFRADQQDRHPAGGNREAGVALWRRNDREHAGRGLGHGGGKTWGLDRALEPRDALTPGRAAGCIAAFEDDCNIARKDAFREPHRSANSGISGRSKP